VGLDRPTGNITAAGGQRRVFRAERWRDSGRGGGEAGPTPAQAGAGQAGTTHAIAVVQPSGGASKGLGIAALILGALGLTVGLLALSISRRKSASQ
jgi:hypothetical protein